MDRLVKADVKEVEVNYKRGQKSGAVFRLTNLMQTMPVAVSVTTSNPEIYSFATPFSIIPPLSSHSYTLVLLPTGHSQSSNQTHDPPLRVPPDVVTVKSSVLPTGKASPKDLKRLFSRTGPHIFRDANLPISLVGPQVAEHLIARHADDPGAASHFASAVAAGCTGSQLTSLLRPAVLSGNAGFVGGLIDEGADVNAKDPDGPSLISLAVRSGNAAVARLLIASGCGIGDGEEGEEEEPLLHAAAGKNQVDVIEALLSGFEKLDVNSVDPRGRTAIHAAASEGHVEAIRCLVGRGGSVDVADSNGWTPLHVAAEAGSLETVSCLVELSRGFSKRAVTKEERKTPFQLASDNGHSSLYETLRFGDELHQAARAGDVDGVRRCLAGGAKVNGRDQNGWTALHRAAFKGRVECVEALLGVGARVDVVDDAGFSPLQCAVEGGHVDVALVLVAHGAKANVKGLRCGAGFALSSGDLEYFKSHAHPCCYVLPPSHKVKERASS